MIGAIEKPVKRYLEKQYGTPTNADTQYMFYRCELCRGIVTWKQIGDGGCSCGVSSRVRAAHLSTWEKIKLLLMPWMI